MKSIKDKRAKQNQQAESKDAASSSEISNGSDGKEVES
jgi:hypothetical protein